MQEHVLRQGFDGTPVAVGILRLQNVYGPGQSLANPYTGVLSIFARALLEGATLNIYEDGRITRDFVFVDDVVAAFAALAVAEQCPDEILDIGTGAGVTILDVAHRMSRLLGLGPERVTISGDFRPGDIRHAVADIGRARAVLGWQPTVGIDTGLSALLDWSRETMGHDLQASDA
jgi:dTDP-L-rhamnose 4-epimerase